MDQVVILSRHSMVSILQYDSGTNGFKTTGQTCYDVESASMAFRSPFFRVLGQFVVVQLTPDTLTFISLESSYSENIYFSVPINLGGPLKLASIDDVQFVSSITSKALVVAILGKSVSHSWIGRSSTIGPNCSTVGVFSVDFQEKRVLLNWTFDDLPTEAFALAALPAPRGGLLVVASESVSYLEDFGSSRVFDSDSLDGSQVCCVSDNLVLFANVDGHTHLAHLVRQPGTFASVTDIVWTRDLPMPAGMKPTSMCFYSNMVFAGSRLSSSFLFRVSHTEVLLPISLFQALDTEEAKLDAYGASDLVDMYREEIHRMKISSSIELGLVDELEMHGQITSLTGGDGLVVATTSSGSRVSLHSELPAELLAELSGFKGYSTGVCNFSFPTASYLVLFGEAGILLINATVGLKESYRIPIKEEEVLLVALTTDDDHMYIVTEKNLFTLPFGKPELLHVFEFPSASRKISSAKSWLARIEDGTHAVLYDMTSSDAVARIESDVELCCIHVSSTGLVTLGDMHGSISVHQGESLLFRSQYISVAPAILSSALAPELQASLSISDPASRPTELDPSVALFAKNILILSAKFCFNDTIVLSIEGRPVLVYKSLNGVEGPYRLNTMDRPYLVSAPPSSGDSQLIPVNPETSLFLVAGDRGEVSAEVFKDRDTKCIATFSSSFASTGIVSVSKSGVLRLFKTSALVVRDEPGESVGFMSAWSAVSGLAVAEAQTELHVPDSMEAEEEDEEKEKLRQQAMFGKRQKFIVSVIAPTGEIRAAIPLQPFEMVTDLAWANTVLGLGPDVLAIGTTFSLGEEQAAQGRILLVRVHPIAEANIIYDSQKGAAVTILKSWKGCLVAALGHRFMFYQWDASAGRLRGCAMYDMALQVTSVAFSRSFILAGDILRGVHLLRYKEDPVLDFQTGVATSMAASISFLAKSLPAPEGHTVVNVGTVRLGNTVGFVAIDKYHNLDLHVFAPLHYGQFLRPSVPFALGFATTAVLPTAFESGSSSLLIGSASGSLAQLVPVTETDHHLASSLSGLMVALLPNTGGLNPRLHHVPLATHSARQIGAVQAVESVDHLLNFLYLSTPLQAEIAARMKLPIETLTQSVASWLVPRWA